MYVGLTLLFGALLAVPEVQSWFWFRWVPFSSLEFFVFLIPAALVVRLTKPLLKSKTTWLTLLMVLNLAYLLFLFPQPIPLLFAAFWFYTVLQWRRQKPNWGYLQGALLLLPLLLKGKTTEIQFWGLSYVTFRAFHLFMDKDLLKDLKFKDYFFFVFYFPAILAGPIDRLGRFRKSIEESWNQTKLDVSGFHLLAVGLLFKFIIAEWLDRTVVPLELHRAQEWVAAFYGYPVYLYFDFAGYSAMAIGFSRLLGIDLPMNFNKPWLSQNPQDFWRRFHISLGDWLRDYFFKPLYRLSHKFPVVGKSALARQSLALFLTFFLMGLWNGPHKNFLLSGALFGLYSMVHNAFLYWLKRSGREINSPAFVWLSRLIMLHFAALALLIFSGLPFRP